MHGDKFEISSSFQEASEQQHPSASAAAENADTDGDCKQDNERPHEPFYRATNSGLVAYSGTHTSVDMNQMFQIMNIHSPTCHARLHHHHGVFQKEFFINRVMDFQNNNNNIRISIPRHLQRAAEAIKEEVNSEYNPVDSTLDEANVQENPTDTKADTESADLSLNTFNFGPDTGLQDHAEIVIQGENPDVEEPANTQGEPSDTVSHSQLPTETQPCDTDVQDPDNITATASNGAEYAEQAIQAFPTTFGKSPPIERPRKVSFCGMDIDLEVPSTSWTDINLGGPIEASTSAEPEAEFKTPRPVRNSPGALKKNRLASVDKGKSTNGTKKGKASKNQRSTGEHANPNAETNADAENPESKEPDTDDEIKAAKIDPKKRKLMRKLSAIGIKRGE